MNTIRRFTLWQIVEHLCGMVLFILLALTGLPQKFSQAGWARWMIGAAGGIDRARLLHRDCGFLFAGLVGVHVSAELILLLSGRSRLSMVPTRKDFLDAMTMLRYYLGLSDDKARFDRFDYRQKFEYWGLTLGSMVMIATGIILYYPIFLIRLVPGEIIPAAKMAHSSGGLLAFLVVITWHIFNAHLSPEVFPFDTSIFTGRIDRRRMQEEHPLEYERMQQTAGAAELREGSKVRREGTEE